MHSKKRTGNNGFQYGAGFPCLLRYGNHAFIEFTGLMNEYTMQSGEDFTECNIHSGKKLRAHDFNENYIREKLECIYSTTFPELTGKKKP